MSDIPVLATPEAREALTQLQSIITGSLNDTLLQLLAQGDTLAEPTVWNGTLATGFRNDTWPQAKAACMNLQQELTDLRDQCQAIFSDIMTAGGN